MRRIDLLVKLSPVHTQPISVPPWEVPIVQLVHGGDVVVVGESRCDLRVPEPGEEYARLLRKYGNNKETLEPRVKEVYGADMMGVRQLAHAMRDDLEEQRELDRPAPLEQAKQSGEPSGASSPANAPAPASADDAATNGKKRGAGGR